MHGIRIKKSSIFYDGIFTSGAWGLGLINEWIDGIGDRRICTLGTQIWRLAGGKIELLQTNG